MSLSCECADDYEYYYEKPSEYIELNSKYKKKCCSCNNKITQGDICIEFFCYEMDENGEEVHKPSNYMCERCADIYFSLDELGFCITLGESMQGLLNDYHTDYLGINED